MALLHFAVMEFKLTPEPLSATEKFSDTHSVWEVTGRSWIVMTGAVLSSLLTTACLVTVSVLEPEPEVSVKV